MSPISLYFHIPFCSKACSYCNFYFSTVTKRVDEFVDALLLEIQQRLSLLRCYSVQTIYFGGGTPSILSIQQWTKIFKTLQPFLPVAEFTIECNPEHLSLELLYFFKSNGVTRISMGVQSVDQSDLNLMNRGHSPEQVFQIFELVEQVRLDSWTIDLIYGVPNFDKTLELISPWLERVPHISSYALTVEPKTALDYKLSRKQVTLPSDTVVIEQYKRLCSTLAKYGFDHYELSNFAKPNHYAKHNSSYWDMSPYIGFGPAAHSFVHNERLMNEAHYIRYIHSISQGNSPQKLVDERSVLDEINETIMVGLRTAKGVDLSKPVFDTYRGPLFEKIKKMQSKHPIHLDENRLSIREDDWMISDSIISDLFLDEDDL